MAGDLAGDAVGISSSSPAVVAQVLKAAQPADTIVTDSAEVTEPVAGIITDVRAEGDSAVRRWSDKLDSWSPPSFRLTADERCAASPVMTPRRRSRRGAVLTSSTLPADEVAGRP